MLILTRLVDESIEIDGGVTITIVRIRGDKVRIGIDAPPHVRILRTELLEPALPADANDCTE